MIGLDCVVSVQITLYYKIKKIGSYAAYTVINTLWIISEVYVNCDYFFTTVFQVHPEGKFVVDIDKNIDIADVTPNCRVALRNDSYTLHKILPNKVWAHFYTDNCALCSEIRMLYDQRTCQGFNAKI